MKITLEDAKLHFKDDIASITKFELTFGNELVIPRGTCYIVLSNYSVSTFKSDSFITIFKGLCVKIKNTLYYIDDNGNIGVEINSDGSYGVHVQTNYAYSEGFCISAHEHFMRIGDDGELDGTSFDVLETYTRNADGNIIQMESIPIGSEGVEHTTYTYSYDHLGRVTRAYSMLDGEIHNVEETEYFEDHYEVTSSSSNHYRTKPRTTHYDYPSPDDFFKNTKKPTKIRYHFEDIKKKRLNKTVIEAHSEGVSNV